MKKSKIKFHERRPVSRATEYNHNQIMLGMASPRVWVAAEDEPLLKVWAASSRSARLLKLAQSEPDGSARLALMASGYFAAPMTEDEYSVWRSAAETSMNQDLLDMVEDAITASESMERHRKLANKHRVNEEAEKAMREDAFAYAYALQLKAIRAACEVLIQTKGHTKQAAE